MLAHTQPKAVENRQYIFEVPTFLHWQQKPFLFSA
jgi:hypothetical protein